MAGPLLRGQVLFRDSVTRLETVPQRMYPVVSCLVNNIVGRGGAALQEAGTPAADTWEEIPAML